MGIFKAHFMKIIKCPLFYIGIILTAAVIGSDHYVAEDAIHSHVVDDVVILLGFSNTRGLIAVCGEFCQRVDKRRNDKLRNALRREKIHSFKCCDVLCFHCSHRVSGNNAVRVCAFVFTSRFRNGQ